jgi:Mn-containing catalase
MEIEEIAKEWAKREYFRQSMTGSLDPALTEEDYTQQVWERAMFEGDQKYRIMKGETVDEAEELATFKAQQERKQVVMLQRAKDEMKELLRDTDDDKKDDKE